METQRSNLKDEWSQRNPCSDKKIAQITGQYGIRNVHYAIYQDNKLFNQKILKSYKAKIIPCEIHF